MKIKVSEATPIQINWMVAKCEGVADSEFVRTHMDAWPYSSDWSFCGPIIEREKIATVFRAGGYWMSYTHENYKGRASQGTGPTPLIAAMRCYVASKMGGDVEVPAELCN